MPPPENWLTKLTKTGVRQPRTHMLWVDARDTPADIEAKRDRMIAAGRARPDDTFAGNGGMKPDVNVPLPSSTDPVGKTTAGRSKEPASAIHCFRLFLTMERATKACEPMRDRAAHSPHSRETANESGRSGSRKTFRDC
jgi:hypothetical protein